LVLSEGFVEHTVMDVFDFVVVEAKKELLSRRGLCPIKALVKRLYRSIV
jgi:hypothetical protein